MRSTLLLPPLAMLASGCVMRPWTPSVSVAYWSATPDVHDVDLPAREDALRRWQLPPADPWANYAKYTLLTALDESPRRAELPDVGALDDVQRAFAAGERIGSQGLPPDTLWLVDCRGAASVAFGVALSRSAREPVSVVPTFNNWPAEDELIPAEETLAALATMSPRLPGADAGAAGARPVFLLDAWRLAYRFDQPDDDTYDNRYILSSTDLPDVATLHARGIRRVVYVVTSLDDSNVEEDDLHPTFLDWQLAGIEIAMVDLDLLERPIPLERWDGVFVERTFLVQPRVTILESPGFYVRSRGGFGGMHARPSPIRVGGGWASGRGAHGGGG